MISKQLKINRKKNRKNFCLTFGGLVEKKNFNCPTFLIV